MNLRAATHEPRPAATPRPRGGLRRLGRSLRGLGRSLRGMGRATAYAAALLAALAPGGAGWASPVTFFSSSVAGYGGGSIQHGATPFGPPRRLPPPHPPTTGLPALGLPAGYQPAVGRFGFLPPRPLATSDGLHHAPQHTGPCQTLVPCDGRDFSPTERFHLQPYAGCDEQAIYGNHYLVPTQRPLVELGLPFYGNGPIPKSKTWCGPTNLVQQKFYTYGDYRMGFAQNKNLNDEATVLAHRINLELDYWMTSTERVHAFIGPFQDGGNFMRIEEGVFFDELALFSDNTDTLFFEGDLGQMLGGWERTVAPMDLPFTVGRVPLFLQKGVWLQVTAGGAAVTLPAKNSPWLDWSNFDVTLFALLDQVSTDALNQAPHTGRLYGATTFVESRGGYLELGYAYVEDRGGQGRSYHNLSASYTRRYLNRVSNSVRVIVNAGQGGPRGARTADGVLLLVENSLLTRNPYNVVPYVNFFAGFGSPQPASRAAAFGGVLFNTGILFQVDALTGFPTLDATGNNTFGAAVGVDLLAKNFDQQLILEAAVLQATGSAAGRNAPGDQYGLGVRWQLPVSEAHLIRADVMHAFTENADGLSGARVEFRWKF
ncbi:MAG: hypothetical protein AAF790_08625 [Planctomycetota bacterium]